MSKPDQEGSDGTKGTEIDIKEEKSVENESKTTVGGTSASTEEMKKLLQIIQQPYVQPAGGKQTPGQKKRAKWLVSQGYTEREATLLSMQPNPNARTTFLSRKERKLERATLPPVGIRMAVAARDYPETLLTEDQSKEIKAVILKEVVQQKEVKPRFMECSFVEGYLSVVCEDMPTRFWLRKTVPKLTFWEGADIKVALEKQLLNRDIWLAYFIKSDNLKTQEILKFLENQNEGIDTSKWVVVSRKEEIRNKQTVELVITLDPDSEVLITNKSCMLKYQFTSILFTKKKKDLLAVKNEVSKNAEIKSMASEMFPEKKATSADEPPKIEVQSSKKVPIRNENVPKRDQSSIQPARSRRSRFEQQINDRPFDRRADASRWENRNRGDNVSQYRNDVGNGQRRGLGGDGMTTSSIWKEYERQMNACPDNFNNNQQPNVRLEDLINLNQQIGNLTQYDNVLQLRDVIANHLIANGFNQPDNGTQMRNIMGNPQMGGGLIPYDNSAQVRNIMGNIMGGGRGPNPSIWTNNDRQSNDRGSRDRNRDDSGNFRGGNDLPHPNIWNNDDRQMNARQDRFKDFRQGNNFTTDRQTNNNSRQENNFSADRQTNARSDNFNNSRRENNFSADRQMNVRSDNFDNSRKENNFTADRQRGNSRGRGGSRSGNRNDSGNVWASDGQLNPTIWNSGDRQPNVRSDDLYNDRQRIAGSEDRQRGASIGSRSSQHDRSNRNRDGRRNLPENDGLPRSDIWNNDDRQMNLRSDNFSDGRQRNISAQVRQRDTSVGSNNNSYNQGNVANSGANDRDPLQSDERLSNSNVWNKSDRQMNARSDRSDQQRNIRSEGQLNTDRQRATSIGSVSSQYGRDNRMRINIDDRDNFRAADKSSSSNIWEKGDRQFNVRSTEYNNDGLRKTRTDHQLNFDRQRECSIGSRGSQYGRDDGNHNRNDRRNVQGGDEFPGLNLGTNRGRQSNIVTNDNTYEQRNIRTEDQFSLGHQRTKPTGGNQQTSVRSDDYSYDPKQNTRTYGQFDAGNQRETSTRSDNNRFEDSYRKQDDPENSCTAPSPPRWENFDHPRGDSPIGNERYDPTDLYDPCNPDDQNDADDPCDRSEKSENSNDARQYESRHYSTRDDPFSSLDNRAPSPPKWNNYDQQKNSRSDDQFGRDPLGGAPIRTNKNQYDEGSRSFSNTDYAYGGVHGPKRFKPENNEQGRDVRSGDQFGMDLPMSSGGDSYRGANKQSYGNSGNVQELSSPRRNAPQKNDRVWNLLEQDSNNASTNRNNTDQYGKRFEISGAGMPAANKLDNCEQRGKKGTEDLFDRNNQGVSSVRDSSMQHASRARIWNAGDILHDRRDNNDRQKETTSMNQFVGNRSIISGINQYPSGYRGGRRTYGSIEASNPPRRDVQNQQNNNYSDRNYGESGNRNVRSWRDQDKVSNMNSNEVEQNAPRRTIGGSSGQSQFSRNAGRNSNNSSAIWNDNVSSDNRNSIAVSKLGLF